MERLLSRFKVVFMGGGAIVMLVLLIAGPVLAYFAIEDRGAKPPHRRTGPQDRGESAEWLRAGAVDEA